MRILIAVVLAAACGTKKSSPEPTDDPPPPPPAKPDADPVVVQLGATAPEDLDQFMDLTMFCSAWETQGKPRSFAKVAPYLEHNAASPFFKGVLADIKGGTVTLDQSIASLDEAIRRLKVQTPCATLDWMRSPR